jgi:hypothetical protein
MRIIKRRFTNGPWRLAVCSLGLTGSLARTVIAQDVVLQRSGGSGGDPYTITCGSKAMVGFQGRVIIAPTSAVSVLQTLCVDLNADGTWIGNPAPGVGIAGVNSGAFGSISCPRDQAVSGISGSVLNTYINTVRISCASLGDGGRTHGTSTPASTSLSAGVTGFDSPAAFGVFLCPDSKPGKGFTGRAHDWIDQVALICNYPSVEPPAVKAISLSSTTAIGGTSVSGTVTLNVAAPASGTPVTVSTNDGSLAAPQLSAITVAQGQRTASFTVLTNPVVTISRVSVTANPNIGAPSATLTLQPPAIKAVSLSADKVTSGTAVTGTLELTGKAFAGGVAMTLVSDNPLTAGVPASVSIREGQTTATFAVTTGSVRQTSCASITASYNAVPRTDYIVVAPASTATTLTAVGKSASLTLTGTSSSRTLTVSFSTGSTVARTVTLTNSNTAVVNVPSSVQVPANASSASIEMLPSGKSGCVIISATDQAGSKSSVRVSFVEGSLLAVSRL